jgi:chromosome segregation ATPase
VTGLLILFTQFDETQVTRVDELRGSVNELKTEAAAWQNHEQGATKTKEALEVQVAALQKDLKSFTKQLDHSMFLYTDFAAELNEVNARNKLRTESLEALKSEVQKLHPTDSAETVKKSTDKLMVYSLSLKTDRAALKAWSLKRHLAKEKHQDADDQAHSEMLVRNLEVVRNEVANLVPQFSNLNASRPIEVTLPTTDAALHQLTQQTPKSLLMMRIIEISLPILLSLISLLFALKYPLTSQKTLEIQEALKKRNQG